MPALISLGACRASLVFPEQSILSLFVRSTNASHTLPFDLTKQKLLRQSTIVHPKT